MKKYSFFKNLNILDTDEFGRVKNQDELNDLIQLHVTGNIEDRMKVIGTVTFHKNQNDFSFKGIIGGEYFKNFFEIWEKTGISRFVLKNWDGKLFYHIDFRYYLENNKRDMVNNYYTLVKNNPEYARLKSNDILIYS